MKENIIKTLSTEKIFPVLRNLDKQKTIDTAKALIEGGIKILEINVENPTSFEAIAEISELATVCAGGIITSLQAKAAMDYGAKIISSPIFHTNLVKFSKDKQIPYIAGTSTANEAYNAWKSRISLVKIYPVTPMGGALYIKDLLRPMPFLNVIPLGSVQLTQAKDYLDAGALAVGIGRDLYENLSYNEITTRIKKALNELKG